MADDSSVTLHITFRTPPTLQEQQVLHSRRFPDVPRSTAQRIEQDFVKYVRRAQEADPKKVYRYRQQQRDARPIMLPLDFEEVVAVSLETS